jgi:DNA-binding transcriptional regulator GbsR (MarR family)
MSTNENFKTVFTNNGQRNIIGNMNDNETVMKKCFTHLNNYKRSRSLKNQTNDENSRLRHELNMFHEIDNLELTLRTLQNNIRRQNSDDNE